MADTNNTKVIIRKADRGNYILDGLCDFWGFPRNRFRIPAHNNPRLKDQKGIAIYILYYIADFRLKDICDVMGYAEKTQHTLYTQRDEMADKLSKYTGDKKIKEEYQQILKHLQL
jgi:hypothetical protein